VLGDTNDVVVVIGTSGADTMTVGVNGVALNADGDADVTFSPLPTEIELRGADGVNTLSARGGSGTGSGYTGTARLVAGGLGDTLRGGLGNDVLTGGAGNDTLEGREGNDVLDGGAGNDSLAGAGGNDELIGGTGADSFSASDGDDVIRANDGQVDTSINGGPGTDTAYYDASGDPARLAVETQIAV
jgi:Ca2+-binding RTX toxin-like protein